jgi:glucose-6-phosphate 1-dehydrogenase
LIPGDALFVFQQDEIKMLWEKLEPIIREEQKRRPHHCIHFEYLFKEWLPLMEKKKMRK